MGLRGEFGIGSGIGVGVGVRVFCSSSFFDFFGVRHIWYSS